MIAFYTFCAILTKNHLKRVCTMFEERIDPLIYDISHKLVSSPLQTQYHSHMHNYCELLLFVSGDAEYMIDGQLYRLQRYDLLLIPSTAYHRLLPKSAAPYENYVIDFSASLITPEHYKKIFTPPYIVNIREDRQMRRYFSLLDFYHEHYSPEDFCKCAMNVIHEILIYCSYQSKSPLLAQSSESPVDRMLQFIAENIEKPLDAAVIADHMALSRSYVQNSFCQVMHTGLKQYIMEKKILCAHNDLVNGMQPGQVAEKYSFSEYSVFFRQYKKVFGCSPRTARGTLM